MANRTNFWKYSANGNHFVLLDGFQGAKSPDSAEVKHLCDPIFGVGADGVAFIDKADSEQEAFRFRLWNSDGGEAEMCGNAARLSAKHFMDHHTKSKHVTFKTMNAVYVAQLDGERLWLMMTEKNNIEVDPALFKEYQQFHTVDTGVPHLVLAVPNVDEIDINNAAPTWRHHEIFPKGTNVDFISIPDKKVPYVKLRVYERGVEDETWSCGTGVSAAAWACQKFFGWKERVTIETKGGEHQVKWDADGSLWYSGEIKLCFTGTLS